MARLTEMFGFEQRVFSLGDEMFCPLKNAIQRWPVQVPAAFSCCGPTYFVLYELSGCRFVLFEYHLCERWTVRRWWWNCEIWVGSEPPKYRELTPDQAVEFLWDYHCELPKSLEQWPEKMLRERARQSDPPPPAIRPLSLWAGTRLVGRHYKSPPDDILAYVDELIEMGVLAVQELRKWDGENTQIPFCVECFIATLDVTFKVDPSSWKSSDDRIPPESVTLLELPWPSKTHQIRERIPNLVELLRPPIAVLKGFRPSKNSEAPTWEEQKAASNALRDTLPDLEAIVVWVRKQLATIRQTQEQAAAEQAARNAVPRPPEDAFLVYHIKNGSGLKQESVASEFTRRTQKPMTQGQVSKYLAAVNEWETAGNVVPQRELPDPRKAISVDPHTLDIGPRQDGQTAAQRGKRDPE